MKKQYLILYLSLLSLIAFNQNRSENYFQQEVNTEISVELLDTIQVLSAFEEIEYINNSNQKLDTLYFHVWPNAYENLNTELGREKILAKDKEYVMHQDKYKGYIDSLDFKVNGENINFYFFNNDIAVLVLNHPLLAGNHIKISTPFRVHIPYSFSRLGYTDESFQLTQWFPKPAVFDKDGWHYFSYRDQGEFYSEYGTYKVKITVPEKYTVASTGNLKSTKSIDSKKILVYSEKNIHDFAWFADSKLKIDIDSVQLPYSQRWVKTISYYNPSSKLWHNANKYIQDAIYYYSLWLGDYPYKTCKAIQSELGAGGGMEYPTITVIGAGSDAFSLESVIMHEVGHNWFYGILGSNERNYPYLDEGLNSAYESRYLETKYPNKIDGIVNLDKFSVKHTQLDYYTYLLSASRNTDQAANLSSEQYSSINYGTIVYKKNAAIINYLRNYLGDDEFDKIMKIYFETWKFKHPQPDDLRRVFENNCDKDLKWFFDDLLSSRKKMDYKISSIKKKDNLYLLKIKNKQSISSPLFIQVYNNDSLITNLTIEGFKKDTILKFQDDFTDVYLDKNYRTIDFVRSNNYIRSSGLFKKTNKISFEFLGSKEKEDVSQVFYSPIMAYNTTNEFMLGLGFFSNMAFPKPFEYLIMPLYSFGNQQVSGETEFKYHFSLDNKKINEISPFISSKSYGLNLHQNYFQIQMGVEFNIRNMLVSNPTSQKLRFYYLIANKYYNYKDYAQFINLEYIAINKKWFNPFNFNVKLNVNKEFALISFDYKQQLTYTKPYTGLNFRFYTGAFLFNNSNNGQYNLSLSGTSGENDYMYQNTLVGRNDSYGSFWGNQFVKDEGGFVIYAPFSSNKWMSSITISSTLPIQTPFELYFTAAAFEGSDSFFNKGVAWELGLQINLIRDMAVIYFPIKSDQQIEETNKLYSTKYNERIRFTLLLNKWNIRRLTRNIQDLF